MARQPQVEAKKVKTFIKDKGFGFTVCGAFFHADNLELGEYVRPGHTVYGKWQASPKGPKLAHGVCMDAVKLPDVSFPFGDDIDSVCVGNYAFPIEVAMEWPVLVAALAAEHKRREAEEREREAREARSKHIRARALALWFGIQNRRAIPVPDGMEVANAGEWHLINRLEVTDLYNGYFGDFPKLPENGTVYRAVVAEGFWWAKYPSGGFELCIGRPEFRPKTDWAGLFMALRDAMPTIPVEVKTKTSWFDAADAPMCSASEEDEVFEVEEKTVMYPDGTINPSGIEHGAWDWESLIFKANIPAHYGENGTEWAMMKTVEFCRKHQATPCRFLRSDGKTETGYIRI